MNTAPFVSILIPIYNVENYIERCARSVFEQTYSNIDYIFVDDASPDKSVEILEYVMKDYPERAEHTQILHHTKNRGLAAARNTALDQCQTEWLMHVDSDDWVEMNMVELLVRRQQETMADIVTGKHWVHKGNVKIEGKFVSELDVKKHIYEALKLRAPFLWARLIRKSLYTVNNIHPIEGFNVGEDRIFYKLLWYAKSVSFVNEHIYHYVTRSDSYTQTFLVSFTKNSFEQDLATNLDACLFFEDKDFKYRQGIHHEFIKIIYYHFINSAGYDKKFHLKVRDLIRKAGSDSWGYPINWDRPIKRFVENHYPLLCMSLPIRRLMIKMRS